MSKSKAQADRAADELVTLLQEKLRKVVEAALKDPKGRIGQADDVSSLVGGIDALKRAKAEGYLVDPSDVADEKIDEFTKKRQ